MNILSRIIPPEPYRRNYLAYVGHGVLWAVAVPLFHPAAVVPVVLEHYGVTPFWIGVAVSLYTLGLSIPLLPIAALTSHRPYRKRWMLAITYIGRAMLIVPVFVLLLAPHRPMLIAVAYTFGFASFWFAEGAYSGLYIDILGRVLPPHWRGRMFAFFQSFGGIFAAVLAWTVVSRALTAADYELGQALLLGGAFTLAMAGTSFMIGIREPAAPVERKQSLGDLIREIPGRLRAQPRFIRLVLVQILLLSVPMSYSFIPLGAQAHLGRFDGEFASMAGSFLLLERIGFVIAAWVWGSISDRFGTRRSMVTIGVIMLIASALPLVLEFVLTPDNTAHWAFSPMYLYGIVYLLMGASIDGLWVATALHVLDLIPEAQRNIYLAIKQTIFSVALIWPVLGGFVVEVAGFRTVYVFTIITVALGLWLACGMVEPREMAQNSEAGIEAEVEHTFMGESR
jgi:MFS family permease